MLRPDKNQEPRTLKAKLATQLRFFYAFHFLQTRYHSQQFVQAASSPVKWGRDVAATSQLELVVWPV